jgi:hypothetical protein
MAGLRFTDLQSRPTAFLDFTSLTLDEFQSLVPPFETAFQAHLATWRLDGKRRTARRFTVSQNCPRPTPEDRLLFILAYVKTYGLQVVHGRLFGMVQGKANQWMHVLLPVLLAALRTLGDAPTRSLTALAQRLGVSEAAAATVVAPLEEAPMPVVTSPAAASASPLLPMTAPHGASSAPKTLRNRRRVRAARKRITRSNMFCSSIPCSRSSSSARPLQGVCTRSASPRLRLTPCLPGVSCCKIWAFWHSPSPKSTSSCRRRNPGVRSRRGSRH